MGSAEDKIDLDSDEEIAFRPSPSTTKVHTFDFETANVLSPVNLASSSFFKRTQIRPIRSMYNVLIKAKINMLLPFGPLAILLHYVTQKHGWVFFFSLLGITPLAERLGYATEQLALYTGPTGIVVVFMV
ncbi:vacuolar cation/proton exchanger 2-like [Prosopis cineraria]|uniref:vacuolar cation/proton exchanger 2-like n=1 Tax=Prosopis cineraria TaxID=364024 RepID=UPI00240FD9F8|nr:vacuolar cation/proton exchanger 2-like [Prosopis cineraria]XP_054793313.1 vacuolar cation/proton exchanger 2-like [Prosopis cineraria]